MKGKVRSELAKLHHKFAGALPCILFFLFLFYSVIFLFGISYTILVSVVTVLFKTNYCKYMTLKQLLSMIGTQFLMACLSFLATLNLPLCLFLNLTVPFLLVFLQSSQFNQLGYFANAMCFTFLQLRPVGWEHLPMELGALAYGMAVLTAALFFCSFRNRKSDSFLQARKGLMLLASVLRESTSPCPKSEATPEGKLFPILQELYKEAYKSRGLTCVVSPRGRIQYMFALLFQRAAYFLSNPYQGTTLTGKDCRGLLLRLAQYMESAGTQGFQQENPAGSELLTSQGKELLTETEGHEEPPYIFVQNFLELFLHILDHIRKMDEKSLSPVWKLPASQQPLKRLFCHMKTDAFETRFALRLSVVLTVGFAYNMAVQANHGYWFALNAFLLLRPMYEDSAFRIRTRFIGTVAGCLLLQILIPLFHGTGWHLFLATVMAAGLYMEKPGTWQQALFSTCFALTLTTLSLPQTLAAELRLTYVVISILLVLAVNRFFFPTSLKRQYIYNLHQIFHIHQVYLRLLERSLKSPIDYGVICDIQIHYHLVHDQIHEYLKNAGAGDRDFIKEILWISWHMVSEAEQMLFLINNRKTSALDVKQMEDYLQFTAGIIGDIQNKLNMKGEEIPVSAENMIYRRSMEGAPHLSRQMEQYSKQVSKMYLCVCRHSESL